MRLQLWNCSCNMVSFVCFSAFTCFSLLLFAASHYYDDNLFLRTANRISMLTITNIKLNSLTPLHKLFILLLIFPLDFEHPLTGSI